MVNRTGLCPPQVTEEDRQVYKEVITTYDKSSKDDRIVSDWGQAGKLEIVREGVLEEGNICPGF